MDGDSESILCNECGQTVHDLMRAWEMAGKRFCSRECALLHTHTEQIRLIKEQLDLLRSQVQINHTRQVMRYTVDLMQQLAAAIDNCINAVSHNDRAELMIALRSQIVCASSGFLVRKQCSVILAARLGKVICCDQARIASILLPEIQAQLRSLINSGQVRE